MIDDLETTRFEQDTVKEKPSIRQEVLLEERSSSVLPSDQLNSTDTPPTEVMVEKDISDPLLASVFPAQDNSIELETDDFGGWSDSIFQEVNDLPVGTPYSIAEQLRSIATKIRNLFIEVKPEDPFQSVLQKLGLDSFVDPDTLSLNDHWKEIYARIQNDEEYEKWARKTFNYPRIQSKDFPYLSMWQIAKQFVVLPFYNQVKEAMNKKSFKEIDTMDLKGSLIFFRKMLIEVVKNLNCVIKDTPQEITTHTLQQIKADFRELIQDGKGFHEYLIHQTFGENISHTDRFLYDEVKLHPVFSAKFQKLQSDGSIDLLDLDLEYILYLLTLPQHQLDFLFPDLQEQRKVKFQAASLLRWFMIARKCKTANHYRFRKDNSDHIETLFSTLFKPGTSLEPIDFEFSYDPEREKLHYRRVVYNNSNSQENHHKIQRFYKMTLVNNNENDEIEVFCLPGNKAEVDSVVIGRPSDESYKQRPSFIDYKRLPSFMRKVADYMIASEGRDVNPGKVKDLIRMTLLFRTKPRSDGKRYAADIKDDQNRLINFLNNNLTESSVDGISIKSGSMNKASAPTYQARKGVYNIVISLTGESTPVEIRILPLQQALSLKCDEHPSSDENYAIRRMRYHRDIFFPKEIYPHIPPVEGTMDLISEQSRVRFLLNRLFSSFNFVFSRNNPHGKGKANVISGYRINLLPKN